MAEAKKFGKREIGLLAGIIVFLIIFFVPLPGFEVTNGVGVAEGLGAGQTAATMAEAGQQPIDMFGNHAGKTCLALSLMTVVFWATGVAQNGFSAGVYLALLCILQVAPPANIFYAWSGTTMWLIIGAYLIANAVKVSGLGERIAYNYMSRFVTDYRSIILGIFVLTVVLSILIPHPWPRAFLIMSVMKVIIDSSGIGKEDAVKIGFAVFVASVPASLIFLTGDATINPLATTYFGGATFVDWLIYMGPPSLIATVLTFILFMVLFKPSQDISINKEEIQSKIEGLGKIQGVELRTLIWLVIAIVLWMTDSIHHIDIAWITFIIGMLLSFPIIGDILGAPDWGAVPMHVLVFLTAAMAIGRIGGITGMNGWIASVIFPSTVPDNLFVLALLMTVLTIVIHMLLGSVIAVMGVAVPAILAFTVGGDGALPAAKGWTLICYMAIAAHFIFPFQHLNMLVGSAPDTGNYTQKETIKLGAPLTVIVILICVVVMVPWFSLLGIL
ncbi:MAG: SLC13 family permease [Atopobiaceae bacterium]|nr:SLC13 family permease [Atopobiaceae bacterium]